MIKISEYIKYWLSLYILKGRIIRLNPEGYEIESRSVMFEDFAQYCWLPKEFDNYCSYDQAAEFFGHCEIEKKFWVCSN